MIKVKCAKTGTLEENCYVVSINNDCLVIDPGSDYDKIRKVIGNKNVVAVLITHYHFDHVGALSDILKEYDVRVIDYNSVGTINIDHFNFEIIPTKGHRDDAVSYYFKDDNIMFVGDFIFKGSIGRCDLEGGSEIDMQDSINRIKEYDEHIILYPGHGDSTTLKRELECNIFLKG